jgi:glycosyltransferase involved in cell wall biosynthesis
MRLAVYTDYQYCTDGRHRYGERAFVLFLDGLRPLLQRLVLIGRIRPQPRTSHYRLSPQTELVGVPHYASLMHPLSVLRSLLSSARLFWRTLDHVDVVWVLGPYPHALLLAAIALLRRRRLVLGVRQDTRAYIRSRRPRQRFAHLAADTLEALWRMLSRRVAVIVVGPRLARQYRHSRRLLSIDVSLVRAADIVAPSVPASRSYDGELSVLTVGRIDAEKNPLLLADILALLSAADDLSRWRLLVCGEGPMREQLQRRFAELRLAHRVQMLGYVPIDGGLHQLYRHSHLFLHVSLTEGFPQVLVEAFAAGLPAVATAVGGVPAAARDAALLIPPDDAAAAAHALRRLADEPALRRRLVAHALRRAEASTLERETARVVEFLAARS